MLYIYKFRGWDFDMKGNNENYYIYINNYFRMVSPTFFMPRLEVLMIVFDGTIGSNEVFEKSGVQIHELC